MSGQKDTRLGLEDLEIQRFFWAPSFEIYNGVAGLFDFGPAGMAIEKNLLARWREHFVNEEDMLEVRCTALTPYKVLEASGHTAKFNDFLVADSKIPSKLYRADQILEQLLAKKLEETQDPEQQAAINHEISAVGDYGHDQLVECIKKFDIKTPDGNDFGDPTPFNLMFRTSIGPGVNQIEGFLRPETAQGIFTNFPRLLDYNRFKLPFAAAQIGSGYRNEIAPRNGLVRVREFQMAEIEHFADPEALNDFPKFETVKDIEVQLWPAPAQEEDKPFFKITLGKAIEDGIICHKTMGYYMGRVYLFLRDLGIEDEKIRFRQHRANEKAHYSRDCWDAEMVCKAVNGWLECVGIADRQSFDLTQHAKMSGKKGELNKKFVVNVPLEKPIVEEIVTVTPNKGVLFRTYKSEANQIIAAIEGKSKEELIALAKRFDEAEAMIGGKPKAAGDMSKVKTLSPEQRTKFDELTTIEVLGKKITYDMYNVAETTQTTNTRTFIPNVIEPSFGVGRIMTVLMEHAFYIREVENRRVLRLPDWLAPTQLYIVPLSQRSTTSAQLQNARALFRKHKITCSIDDSSVTIGKKYARIDETGTPYIVTMDFQTNEDNTVTLRERDSTEQVRAPIQEVVTAIRNMIHGIENWESIKGRMKAATVSEE